MPQQSVLSKIRRRARRASLLGAKAALEAWRGLSGRGGPEQTVFVAGAQRSGTNMIMNVLDRSYETKVYHERDPRAFDEYLMREPEVIQGLRDSAHAPVFVIKCLCEMDKLPWLMERFAPAKTIWMVRHYDDVINSAMRIFGKLPSDVANIMKDPSLEDWRGRGISDETLALMRSIYYPELNEESRVAMFWYMRNQMFFDHGFHHDVRVLPMSYERLVTDPHPEFRRMFDFLGVGYHARISRFVSAQSVRKEGAPPVDQRIREVCDRLLGRFTPYMEGALEKPEADSERSGQTSRSSRERISDPNGA
jgi:hypothetical protein